MFGAFTGDFGYVFNAACNQVKNVTWSGLEIGLELVGCG
jgi:hypothetical protein